MAHLLLNYLWVDAKMVSKCFRDINESMQADEKMI